MNEGEANAPQGEPLGGEPFEDAGVEPIDPVDGGGGPSGPAETLAALLLADPEKSEIKSGATDKLFAAIQKLQRPGADPDALNNAGCAWALLAYSEARVDYWPRALKALKASADHQQASVAQKTRAEDNHQRVVEARQEATFD
jgi:hypothetical protein